MYIIKEIKRIIFSKSFIFSMLLMFCFEILSFLNLKTNFFYEIINYIPKYLNYYVSTYLGGSLENLISNNHIWFFVENDVMNIFSSIYVYFITNQGFIFSILMFIVPIVIFHVINVNFYDEFNSKFFKNICIRIGEKKYILQKIAVLLIIGGLLAVIPKVLYYLILKLFYVNGYSNVHYIMNDAFVPYDYIFIKPGFNPQKLLVIDFITTFIYGIIISIISIVTILYANKKVSSYLYFIFFIFLQTLLSYFCIGIFGFITFSPIFYFYSINEYVFFNENGLIISKLIIQLLLWFIITIPILIYLLKKNFKVK